jgi:integrase/recombinase XerD
MRKKSGFIPIVIGIEQAMVLVPKFENVVSELGQQVAPGGQSNSTLKNYIRRIALFVIHFGKLLSRSVQRELTATWLLWPATPGRSRTAALNI